MNGTEREDLFEQQLTQACAQLRRAREQEARQPKRLRRLRVIAAACAVLLALVAAGTGALYLADHTGTMQLEAVYNEDGTRAYSPDGYPLWVVVKSADPDMRAGTYLVVDPDTNDYAVYAPPADTEENQAAVAAGTGAPRHAPLLEYRDWTLLENGSLRVYAQAGTPLYAMEAGTVTEAAYQGQDGYRITVRCENGESYQYAHCAEFAVRPGDTVAAGQVIAFVGSTGRAEQPLCTITGPDEWEIDSFFTK